MEINREELKKICLDFFRLCGMEFSLWDENQNNIFSYPDVHSPFCKAVRSDRRLYRKCLLCDKAGLDEALRTKAPYIYTCHMGLTEGIVPILQDDEVVGYLMLGQIAEEENREKIIECINSAVNDSEQRRYFVERLRETTSCSNEKVGYCINTLKILIDYMNLSFVIGKSGENTFYLAKKYIASHISQSIMPRDICAHIGVSANTLYKSIEKNTGMSSVEFIRKMKMDEARRLLLSSDESISRIAEQVGFSDVNYFIRVFRREEGVPPLRFRKENAD